MAHYRKKPVIIEAKLVEQGNHKDIAEWCNGRVICDTNGRTLAFIIIDTLEGKMKAEIGDYIIKGVKGEFYPCKPDIFHETYEKLEGVV